MEETYEKRRCSAVRADGEACRAWAMRDSQPALCAIHAGRNVGGGAPPGNRNAWRHGYYAKALLPALAADIENMQDDSLMGELVLGRYVLGQLAAYLAREDVGAREKLAVVPLINTTIRTVAFVAERVDFDGDLWDQVLDAVGAELGIDI